MKDRAQEGRQYLNAMDRMEVVMDEIMRGQGISGYETQVLVWLGGQADVTRITDALARLCRRHPVVTGRLVKDGRPYEPYWRLRPDGECCLREHDVGSAEDSAVLDLAARLLSTPRDLGNDDPVSFHLLHRRGGRDVFLVQINHVLAGIKALLPLLLELDQLSRDRPAPAPIRPSVDDDLLPAMLRQIPVRRRLGALFGFLGEHVRQRAKPVAVLGDRGRHLAGAAPLRCLTRTVDPETVRAVEAHAATACGFSSLSMTLLASAFRALAARQRGLGVEDYTCAAIIGLDLGLKASTSLAFRNFVSSVTVRVTDDEVQDRDELVRRLNARLRDGVQRGEDLAIVEISRLYARHPRALAAMGMRQALTEGSSFGYAYFGSFDALGPAFCGTAVKDVNTTATHCPPAGLGLFAQKFRERLVVQLVYIPALVVDDVAEAFLEATIADLTDIQGGH